MIHFRPLPDGFWLWLTSYSPPVVGVAATRAEAFNAALTARKVTQ